MRRAAAALTFALAVAIAPLSSVEAQYTPPTSWPADALFTPVLCGAPPIPSHDPCDDDARDHRNIIGGGDAPAYTYHQSGDYLFLRMRVEADPRQSGAFVAFAWGFGIDSDGDGRFEAYISLIGQGMFDRLEVLDQDPGNGTTPDLTRPTGGGLDTSLRPIDTTGGPTWATATVATPSGAMPNFCADRPTDDWFITVAVPLEVLRDFGALGGAIAYAGSSSEFSGIQNDMICATGRAASCTTGATCPSGVCLVGTGRCAPPIVPFFLGCLADDADADGIDDGCTSALQRCLVTSSGSSCVECLTPSDCSAGNACTVDACTSNTCSSMSRPIGATCPGGVCDGASTPACV
ncbi:MAG: hypothetical protein M3Y87_31625, partial [Myxococcota bacterium]|nr:hypothetical protein [Myxococcota bacterium]